jgi:hypothetical protein
MLRLQASEATMGDGEDEQLQDVFEVEITDLDEPDQHTADTLASSGLKPSGLPLKPGFLRRHRKLQLLITTSIIALAILVILASTTGIRNLVFGGSAGSLSTSTTSSPPHDDLFYFQLNPPWGHLSIDGHAVAHVPTVSTDSPLSLPPGQHRLLWQAAPFQPVSCILVVPVNSNPSTCNHSQFTPVNTNLLVSIVNLRVSTALLPAGQRTALLAATRATFDKEQHSETVLPGEAYAVPSQIAVSGNDACRLETQVVLCFTTAKQMLQATLRFQLDTDTSYNGSCTDINVCSLNGFDCRYFCSLSDGQWPDSPFMVPPDSAWDVVVPVQFVWQYTTLAGQVLAENEADNFVGGTENEYLVSLRVEWDGTAWHVSIPPSNQQDSFPTPVCNSALQDAGSLTNGVVINGQGQQIETSFQSAYDSNFAAGCLIKVTQQQSPFVTPTPTSSPPLTAYLLHRFGVLVAANAEAHRLWPFLPLADANEMHVVKQLMPELEDGYATVS